MTEAVARKMGAVLVGVAAAAALASWAGFFGAAWPGVDVLAHFRLHYQLGFIVLLASALVLRRRRAAVWIAALAAPNALALASAWAGPAPDRSATPDLTVVALNVLTSNRSFEPVRRYLESADADIVVLQEVNQEWLDGLAPALRRFEERVAAPRDGVFGIALYSRVPLVEASVIELGNRQIPAIAAEILLPNGRARLIGTHLSPPVSRALEEEQLEQAEAIRRLVAGSSVPSVIIGDLNATPWGRIFSALAGETRLARSHTRGLHATWPAQFGRLGIPIDHALHTPGLEPLVYEVGPDLGSDHRPIRVRYRLDLSQD